MADKAEDEEYEVLHPPTDLRSKVRELTPREAKKFDPVKAAEAALERLSPHFAKWMESESSNLLEAWDVIRREGVSADTLDPLYQAAHNIKGQALTLGFPLVGEVAASFCNLIENLPSPEALPLELTERFVEAIRAMVAEGARDGDNRTGVELLAVLRTVSDSYLAQLPSADKSGD